MGRVNVVMGIILCYTWLVDNNQSFKAVYFQDYKSFYPSSKGLTLAFGKKDQHVFEAVRELDSSALRKRIGFETFKSLKQAAEQEGLSVNTFCLWLLKKDENSISGVKGGKATRPLKDYEVDMGNRGIYNKKNKLNDLTAKEWIPETVSVYVQRGLGANSAQAKIEKEHPAPFSFQDVSRLINFFTKQDDKVLDPFCGVGSTLKACALSNRRGVGIELVKKYVDLSKRRLKEEVESSLFGNKLQEVIEGDALQVINRFDDDSIDFIVTSPPYWNILEKADHKVKRERLSKNLDTKYSELKKDLGNIEDYKEFLVVLGDFFNDCSRILKPNKYMCVIVSDFRHKNGYYMFHSDLVRRLEGHYDLKGITILYQRHKSVYPYGYPYSYVPNIHHQYILIFQNKKDAEA